MAQVSPENNTWCLLSSIGTRLEDPHSSRKHHPMVLKSGPNFQIFDAQQNSISEETLLRARLWKTTNNKRKKSECPE